jgi:LPS-assembly protein
MGLLSRRLVVPLAVLLFLLEATPALAEGPSAARPIHIQADTLVYSKETQTYHGKGSVVVVQGPYRLEADEATLNVATGQVTAVGRVHLNDGAHDIHGERLDFNFNTTKGVIFHGRLFVLEGNFTVDAQVMERLSEEQYRLEDASFTTCSVLEGERTPWQFKAEKAELEVEGYLYARNVQFCILDVPVMYLPAVLFPAKRERATGFLIPVIGSSSVQGFKVREAFFWNISPSQDATITLDERGKLGTGGTLEYRYKLSRDSDGYFWTQYFRDVPDQTTRWDVIYKHTSKFSEDLQGRVNINYVNQRANLFVLSEDVLQRVATYQESNAFLSNRWDNQVLYGLARYSQNLTNLSDKTVVQTLPEIGYSLTPWRLGGLPVYSGLDATFDDFARLQGTGALRTDLFPRLWASLPWDRYITVTPLVGFRETYYNRSLLQSDRPTSREALYLSTTVDTRLVRRFAQEGGVGITHKIEPALIYEYLTSTRQGDLPIFNDVDQLFPKHLLTYELTNRLSTMVSAGDTMRYLEFAYLRLTQSQHLDSPNRTLSTNVGSGLGLGGNQASGFQPTGRPFSDLRGELILRTLQPIPASLDVDTFYNYTESAVSVLNTDLNFELRNGYFLSLGQRFTRAGPVPVRGDLFNPLTLNDVLIQTEKTHFYTAEVGTALPFNLYAVIRGYYDAQTGRLPEVDYGLYYVNPSRCWGVGVLLIERGQIPGVAPAQTEFAFLFTLGGVGSTDSPFNAVYQRLFQRLGLDIQKLREVSPPPSSARPF